MFSPIIQLSIPDSLRSSQRSFYQTEEQLLEDGLRGETDTDGKIVERVRFDFGVMVAVAVKVVLKAIPPHCLSKNVTGWGSCLS
jgi:hypothetical protein